MNLQEKIPFRTKLAYGAGELGPAMTGNVLIFFLLFFLTNVAGLNPALAGSIYMVGKLWDAINDPLIGILSDKTKSRWGRRLPWLIFGALPFGLFFFLQWLVPFRSQWPLFWYYVAIALGANVFYTVVSLPYCALTAEMSRDYDERTSLNSFRFAFSIGGSIGALLLAQAVFSAVEDSGRQFLMLGATGAILSLATLVWCIIGIKARVLSSESDRLENEVPTAPIALREQIGIAFRNRPFLYVIGIFLFSWLGVQLTASVLPFYVVTWMGLEKGVFAQVALTVQGVALAMLFVWGKLTYRFGKRHVYSLGMAIWILAQGGLFFLQPGQTGIMYFLAVMAGFGVSTAYLIPWSMMPDVIDLDELETGHRREGVFYGFMVLLQKIGLAGGLFLVGQALALAGFQESSPDMPELAQPPSALLAIRIAIGPLPTLFLIVGLILTWLYPITREKHAVILDQLVQRRSRRTTADS